MRDRLNSKPAMQDMTQKASKTIDAAAGQDPRRQEAKIIIERVVSNHDQSGYNHNGVQDSQAADGNNDYKKMMDKRVKMDNSDSVDK